MPDGLRLTVLGSGSCELRRQRSSPSYLLMAGGNAFLLDLGQGAWRALTGLGVAPATVKGILLSHHHLDHIGDLLPLLFALNYDPLMRETARISLFGHPGLAKVLEGLAGVFGSWARPPQENLRTVWLEDGDRRDLAGLQILAGAASHIETSLAYRLGFGGVSLVYLGDSEYSPALAELAQGAELVVAHCAASDERPKPGHLGPSQAGRLAAEAGAKALLLSHFYREVDPLKAVAAAGKVFDGRVFAAEDGMCLDLGPDAGAKLHKS